ncbi:hypothetical protein [Maridesulfovibrio sp.]|uniref:hypothetical protein n=1 Tax=Maridesulfovibrio sp. TaxID=2795000 RepID=UPI0029CA5695|nr:hypothetical protein [Maridesulfovibrio sp.]
MDSKGLIFTKRGDDLMKRALTGTLIQFSHVEYGTGVYSEDVKFEELESLVDSKLTLPIQEIKNDDDGTAVLTVAFTNGGLAEGFTHTETGVYADDPIHGKILYAVHYSSAGGYIPPGGSAYIVEDVIDYMLLVGRNVNVAATINNMVVLATKVDIDDHNTDPEAHWALLARLATGIPEILNPLDGAVDVGETPIYRFREFVPTFAGHFEDAIQVQVDLEVGNFTAPIHDTGWLTTISGGYEQPAGMLQPVRTRYKARCRRRLNSGDISPWSEVIAFETRNVFNYVQRPINISPSQGATGVMECPTLYSSPFVVVGDTADVHEATQYRMRIGDTVLHLSPELGAVIEYDFPAGLLLVSGDYVWEVRYKGTAFGWSEWSTSTSFHTASAFITGDEAISFTSWNEYDNASAAGVALADGAALYSNGVDQDTDDGDWTSIQSRMKIRGNRLELLNSTAETITTREALSAGAGLALDLGVCIAGDVTQIDDSSTELLDISAVTHSDGFGDFLFNEGDNLIDGDESTYSFSLGVSGNNVPDGEYFQFDLGAVRTVAFVRVLSYNLSKQMRWLISDSPDSDFVEIGSARTYIQGQKAWESVDLINTSGRYLRFEVVGDIVAGNDRCYEVEIYGFAIAYLTDISSAGFSEAPAAAAVLPKITAATGPAGTAFTAADFNEIAIAKATLGTDTDTDRPDFILLESEKITPAEAFRRVAIGASGLSKDTLINITETQCDTWKQGA